MSDNGVITDFEAPRSVDLFAGGGGASEGIRRAFGRAPLVAIDHDPASIAMHAANHPNTLHLCESVFDVEPFRPHGRPLDLLWASPDCTHFSRARGAKPRSKETRELAWVVVTWARAVRPTVIGVENVGEFKTWGPLDDDGHPILERAGETFHAWVAALEQLGYAVEWRELVAADYGAPTTRKRLFILARCDGRPIVWPEPTHGEGRAQLWRTAAECIDWTIPCPSIFTRKKPLAEKTQARIAEGLRRFLFEDSDPFIAPIVTATGSQGALVHAWLVKHYGGVTGHRVDRPLGAITTRDHHGVVVAHLQSTHSNSVFRDARKPVTTITASEQGHQALVAAFLTKYYGSGGAQSLRELLHTIVSKARFGLVTVTIGSEEYALVDVGMRMLQPRELATAQGFGEDYKLVGTIEQQTGRIGNSAPPDVVARLTRAQFEHEPTVAANPTDAIAVGRAAGVTL